jgi:hypothetical protein
MTTDETNLDTAIDLHVFNIYDYKTLVSGMPPVSVTYIMHICVANTWMVGWKLLIFSIEEFIRPRWIRTFGLQKLESFKWASKPKTSIFSKTPQASPSRK